MSFVYISRIYFPYHYKQVWNFVLLKILLVSLGYFYQQNKKLCKSQNVARSCSTFLNQKCCFKALNGTILIVGAKCRNLVILYRLFIRHGGPTQVVIIMIQLIGHHSATKLTCRVLIALLTASYILSVNTCSPLICTYQEIFWVAINAMVAS